MKTRSTIQYPNLPKYYAGLCQRFLPRPIRDAVGYANLTEVADAMALWQDDFNADQADYFDLLCSLIEEYDAAQVKWPKQKGRTVLQHLMAEQGLTAADLSRLLGGSRNIGSMILRGERNLTLDHIRKLATHFKVGAEAFMG